MTTDLVLRVEPRDGDPTRGFLIARCARSKSGECRWPLWAKAPQEPTWQWDGNVSEPTITPSIDCQNGCGRHFTVTRGVAG